MALLTRVAVRLSPGNVDVEVARRLALRCAATCHAYHDRILLANTLTFLAQAGWLGNRIDEAVGYAREALRLRGTDTAAHNLAQLVEFTAWISATAGQPERAAVLLGAADRVWRGFGLHALLAAPLYRDRRARCEGAARAALGDAAFAAGYARGRGFSLAETVEFAAGGLAAAGSTVPDGILTRRQRQVAALVAEGLSNKQIATRLGVSRRTVETHVEHILARLGFGSRAQVAAWAARYVTGRPP
jgi:DNA-binding CsgD family transcriptional regulator